MPNAVFGSPKITRGARRNYSTDVDIWFAGGG